MKKKSKPLTLKQEKFVREYIVDGNGTQAAIRAGYSPKGADVRAIQLLGNDRIAKALSKHRKNLLKKVDVTPKRVLEEYGKLAFINPQDLFDSEGVLLPIQDMPRDTAAALTSLKITDGQLQEVKWSDKAKALRHLGEHLGMFVDRKDVNVRFDIGFGDAEPEPIDVTPEPDKLPEPLEDQDI